MSSAVSSASELVDMSVIMDGWTMLPIADAGATTHIIAARNDDEALTTDIDVVVYEKTLDGWSGSAYDPSVTKEDAFIDIADEFGLSDPFDGTWQIDLDEEDVFGFVLPRVAFGKGFFVTDPLYEIANHLDDPESLAQGAETAGLPAGSGAINTGSISGVSPGGTDVGGGQPADCSCDACIQTAIAAGADALLIEPGFTSSQIDAVIDANLHQGAGCCPERVTYGTVTNGAWICSAWVFQETDPTPGGVTCRYKRDAFRLQSRTYTIRCIGDDICTVLEGTQNRIESGTQTGSTLAATAAGCTPPVGVVCVAGALGRTYTSWAPPLPDCP